MADIYREVSVTATKETEEGLSDFFSSEGALGLITEDAPGEPLRVLIRASFAGSVDAASLIGRLRHYQESLAALGFSGSDGAIEARKIPLEDWGRKWKEGFKPLPVGRRLLIVPPWERGPFPEGRVIIWIDPAMAFGTGHHATTQMCLEAIEDFMDHWVEARRPVVLDAGTGTGILAIAAAALGAERIVAIDTDPEACDAARKNLGRHDCAGPVQIQYGGIEALNRGVQFDLILANLDTKTLCPLFGSFSALLASDGHLIATGIPVEDHARVATAISSTRLRIVERRVQDGWLCLGLVLA